MRYLYMPSGRSSRKSTNQTLASCYSNLSDRNFRLLLQVVTPRGTTTRAKASGKASQQTGRSGEYLDSTEAGQSQPVGGDLPLVAGSSVRQTTRVTSSPARSAPSEANGRHYQRQQLRPKATKGEEEKPCDRIKGLEQILIFF